MAAKTKPHEQLNLADIGVEPARAGAAGSKTEVLSLSASPARGDTRKITDEGNGAQEIFDYLIEKKLL